ncbi:MAG TPA: hypothetical protein V6D19_13965 [Stenomitos sp.]
MNLRLILKLITLPTLLGSLLMLANTEERASAANVSTSTPGQLSCDWPSDQKLKESSIRHHQNILLASSGLSDTGLLSFSEAESDAAAVLFGCDCSACINALQQLRRQPLLKNSNGNGHCLSAMQRRVSPQKMQEVLQKLDMSEAEQTR